MKTPKPVSTLCVVLSVLRVSAVYRVFGVSLVNAEDAEGVQRKT
jgi:hypothetical protein